MQCTKDFCAQTRSSKGFFLMARRLGAAQAAATRSSWEANVRAQQKLEYLRAQVAAYLADAGRAQGERTRARLLMLAAACQECVLEFEKLVVLPANNT